MEVATARKAHAPTGSGSSTSPATHRGESHVARDGQAGHSSSCSRSGNSSPPHPTPCCSLPPPVLQPARCRRQPACRSPPAGHTCDCRHENGEQRPGLGGDAHGDGHQEAQRQAKAHRRQEGHGLGALEAGKAGGGGGGAKSLRVWLMRAAACRTLQQKKTQRQLSTPASRVRFLPPLTGQLGVAGGGDTGMAPADAAATTGTAAAAGQGRAARRRSCPCCRSGASASLQACSCHGCVREERDGLRDKPGARKGGSKPTLHVSAAWRPQPAASGWALSAAASARQGRLCCTAFCCEGYSWGRACCPGGCPDVTIGELDGRCEGAGAQCGVEE